MRELRPVSGPVEEAARAAVEQARADGEGLDAAGELRAAVIVSLAETLDDGAGMAAAAVARELRAALADMVGDREAGPSDAFAELLAELATPVKEQ